MLLRIIIFFLLLGKINLGYAHSTKDSLGNENVKPIEVLPPIERKFDTSSKSIDSILESPKFKQNFYRPFFRSLDFSLEYGGILWDLFQRLNRRDKILSLKGGIGLFLKWGIYGSVTFGYSHIQSKGIPKHKKLPKYTTKGFHTRIGTGYYFEYLRGGIVGLSLRYGISVFDGSVENSTEKNMMKAHYLDIIIDTKGKIIQRWNFYLGIFGGIQFLLQHDSLNNNIKNYLIPGYGRNVNKTGVVGGLYIQYSIPFYKTYISAK